MRLNLALVLLMMLAGYSLTQYLDQPKAPAGQAIQHATDFSFRTMDGTAHKLSDFRGKIVILNFWASWCAPCVREFPTLLNAAEQNKGRAVLIALSYDLNDPAMMRFLETMKKKGHNWEKPHIYIARDDQDIAGKLFGTTQFPETFIIDGAGQIRDKFIGAGWDLSGLNASIKKLQ